MKQSRYMPLNCLLLLALAGCQNEGRNDIAREIENPAVNFLIASVSSEGVALSLADHDGADYTPTIAAGNFVVTIDHPFFTLVPGRVWIYAGQNEDGERERVGIEVTDEKKAILGIATTVVREREWENGELVEDPRDWFAQQRSALQHAPRFRLPAGRRRTRTLSRRFKICSRCSNVPGKNDGCCT